MRQLLAGVFLALLSSSGARAAVGTAAAPFLDLSVGGRNVAMGGTGALDETAYAAYWNPAGLNAIDHREAAFTYGAFLPGVDYQYLAYAQKIGSGTFALSADYVSVADIAKVDNTGALTGGTYKPWDGVFGLSYARAVLGFPVGATVKYISSSIDDVSAQSVALDLGADLTPLLGDQKELALAVAMQNLGPGMKFVSETDPLPLKFKAGATWTPAPDLLLAVDVNEEKGAGFSLGMGGEYLLHCGPTTLAARAGYEDDRSGLDGVAGLTAGIGFELGRFMFDYAFAPMGDAGAANRLSLRVKF